MAYLDGHVQNPVYCNAETADVVFHNNKIGLAEELVINMNNMIFPGIVA